MEPEEEEILEQAESGKWKTLSEDKNAIIEIYEDEQNEKKADEKLEKEFMEEKKDGTD